MHNRWRTTRSAAAIAGATAALAVGASTVSILLASAAMLTPTGSIDTARGIREIVAGTGGRSHYGFGTPIIGSEVRNSTAYGVRKVTLKPNSYDWQFLRRWT